MVKRLLAFSEIPSGGASTAQEDRIHRKKRAEARAQRRRRYIHAPAGKGGTRRVNPVADRHPKQPTSVGENPLCQPAGRAACER